MRKIRLFISGIIICCFSLGTYAQNLGDLLSGVIQGVFSSSDITIADIAGSYVSTGPAVTFKSDNFLQKAGGIAGAAALESKLKPYYEQYGLTGLTLEIDKDANFTMQVKGIKLSGVITKNEGDGTFLFNLKALGMNVGSFTAYIEKSLNNLKVMFDADKLLQIISTVAKFTGNSIVSSLGTLLKSYDGACIGFNMTKQGDVSTDAESDSDSTPTSSKSGVGGLLDLINKNK